MLDESNLATGFVPESEKSSFTSFVRKAMGGIDLSRITAPPFILAPQSQLETNAELMSHPDTFSRYGHGRERETQARLCRAAWLPCGPRLPRPAHHN